MTKNLIYILSLAAFLAACMPKADEAKMGFEMINEAREYLEDGQYNAARNTILSLRQNHPTAIEARRQGILLMDSVEWLGALDSLKTCESDQEHTRLELKAEFFMRKLEFDRKQQEEKQIQQQKKR